MAVIGFGAALAIVVLLAPDAESRAGRVIGVAQFDAPTATPDSTPKRPAVVRLEMGEAARLREVIARRYDPAVDVTLHYARPTDPSSVPRPRAGATASLYLMTRGDISTLFLRIASATDEWLFWDRATFVADGERLEIPVSAHEKQDNIGDGVQEWLDLVVSDELFPAVARIASADSVSLTLLGKFRGDYVVPQRDIKAMRDMLAYWRWQQDGGLVDSTASSSPGTAR